jgi:hypothetical protein
VSISAICGWVDTVSIYRGLPAATVIRNAVPDARSVVPSNLNYIAHLIKLNDKGGKRIAYLISSNPVQYIVHFNKQPTTRVKNHCSLMHLFM